MALSLDAREASVREMLSYSGSGRSEENSESIGIDHPAAGDGSSSTRISVASAPLWRLSSTWSAASIISASTARPPRARWITPRSASAFRNSCDEIALAQRDGAEHPVEPVRREAALTVNEPSLDRGAFAEHATGDIDLIAGRNHVGYTHYRGDQELSAQRA